MLAFPRSRTRMDVSSLALLRVRSVFAALDLAPPPFLENLPAKAWLPQEDPLAWLRDAQGQALPLAVRFHLGTRTLESWYHEAGGFSLCPRALQVLRFHADAGSYRQLVRGPQELIGRFALLGIDESAGTAQVHSSTPFCREWERGMVQGALDAAGDLLFSDVQWHADTQHFEVRFVSEDNRDRIAWALGEPEEAKVWRLRNRLRQLEQLNSYLEARARLHLPSPAIRSASPDWLDPNSGAVSEAELTEQLHARTQSALPQQLSLIAFGTGGPRNNEQQRLLGAAGLRLTRQHDLLANLGPDGLALLLADVDQAGAQRIAQRLADELQAQLMQRLKVVVLPWQGAGVISFVQEAKRRLAAE